MPPTVTALQYCDYTLDRLINPLSAVITNRGSIQRILNERNPEGAGWTDAPEDAPYKVLEDRLMGWHGMTHLVYLHAGGYALIRVDDGRDD